MPSKQAAPPENDSVYPLIESLIERATPEELGQLFVPVREGLQQLKGPRAEQGKKVEAALVRVEELLGHLIQVRERLEAERSAAKGRR